MPVDKSAVRTARWLSTAVKGQERIVAAETFKIT